MLLYRTMRMSFTSCSAHPKVFIENFRCARGYTAEAGCGRFEESGFLISLRTARSSQRVYAAPPLAPRRLQAQQTLKLRCGLPRGGHISGAVQKSCILIYPQPRPLRWNFMPAVVVCSNEKFIGFFGRESVLTKCVCVYAKSGKQNLHRPTRLIN